ncbi:NnrU family protein [Pleomorphomonas sp. NRK KF1]|uniref:NnrU family protein n=1 Tax=Pleomorphomonas sp. NRK KF1 TaxID=2943000 RepID=UPI0020445A2C|nr:NnrU family protein [Pleomorphomonas sp. NRK KF1]MCM5552290.1 NnrU family protein [Pleomorphomonas sp. NRK KF1]
MSIFLVGLVLFIGIHSIYIVAPGVREAAIARIGYNPWRGVYSLVSLAGLLLLIYGYGLARQDPVPLFEPPSWARLFAFALMVVALPLLVASFFPVPTRIGRFVRHPMLMSVTLWSVAHALAVGTLAGVLLSAVFFVWTLAARFSLVARPMTTAPVAAPEPLNDWIAVAIGLAVWAALMFVLHDWLIGMPLL